MSLKKHRITVESSVSIEAQYKYISLKNTCPQYFSPDKVQVIDKSNEPYKKTKWFSQFMCTQYYCQDFYGYWVLGIIVKQDVRLQLHFVEHLPQALMLHWRKSGEILNKYQKAIEIEETTC